MAKQLNIFTTDGREGSSVLPKGSRRRSGGIPDHRGTASGRNLLRQILNGPKKEWHPNGAKIFQVGMKEGKPHGEALEWFPDESKKSSTFYRHGLREGPAAEWYPSGQQSMSISFQKDKRHGLKTTWYENGQKRIVADFIDDMMEGNSKGWFSNGQLAFDYNFEKDQEHGICTEWNENGQKVSELRFVNGKPVQNLITGLKIETPSATPKPIEIPEPPSSALTPEPSQDGNEDPAGKKASRRKWKDQSNTNESTLPEPAPVPEVASPPANPIPETFTPPPPPAPATNFDPSESEGQPSAPSVPTPPPPADPAPETLAPPPPPPPAPPAPTLAAFTNEGQPLPEVPAPPPPPAPPAPTLILLKARAILARGSRATGRLCSRNPCTAASSTRAARSDFRSLRKRRTTRPRFPRHRQTLLPNPCTAASSTCAARSDFRSLRKRRTTLARGPAPPADAAPEPLRRRLLHLRRPLRLSIHLKAKDNPCLRFPRHRQTLLRRQTPAQYLLRMFSTIPLQKAYRPLLLLILSILRPTTNIKSKDTKKGQRVRWQPGRDSNPD